MDGGPPPDQFWAKLHPDYPEETDWHPLLAHSADVAAVTEGSHFGLAGVPSGTIGLALYRSRSKAPAGSSLWDPPSFGNVYLK